MEALILVDIQNDFCEGGALAVPEAAAVVPVANALLARFSRSIATQDSHPRAHLSFAANHPGREAYEVIDLDGLPQVLWPVHCVAGTKGAEFHPGLDARRITRTFTKGTDPRIDSYSGFFDNGKRKETGLGAYLREAGVRDLFVLGLATDYCVRATALDGVGLGFRVHLVTDGCRGVGLAADDVPRALAEMAHAGVIMTTSRELLSARV